MLIQLIVVILLIIWASDKDKALGPALVYSGVTLAFGLLMKSGGMISGNVFVNTGVEFLLAFGLFWLVSKTGGLVGWLVRGVTILVLGGVLRFLMAMRGN